MVIKKLLKMSYNVLQLTQNISAIESSQTKQTFVSVIVRVVLYFFLISIKPGHAFIPRGFISYEWPTAWPDDESRIWNGQTVAVRFVR